jgi:mannan endo-1,4-beta-mannosidase
MKRVAGSLVTAALLVGCASAGGDGDDAPPPGEPPPPCTDCTPTDPQTPVSELRANLLANLLAQMNSSSVLFGQERFNITGVNPDGTQWFGAAPFDRSDAKTVAGDHPVVMGFDAWDLAIKPAEWAPTGKDHAAAARAVHAQGGIVSLDFHMHGCAVDSFNATGNEACLCRAANDDAFARSWLLGEYKKVADAIEREKLDQLPMIFRPLHEHSGNWFWWGQAYWDCARYVSNPRHTGAAAYARVYKTIVSYMRDVRKLEGLLVAYSPGDTTDYFAGYPGDEYVDIFGIDLYYGASPTFAQQTTNYRARLEQVTAFAREHHKVAALTEVGNTQLSSETTAAQSKWFVDHLLPLVTAPDVDVAYAMTWENRTSGPQQFWVPYPNHPGVADFRAFAESPGTKLITDVPAFESPPPFGYPVCQSCQSDPDGDRWGWEKDKSCRVGSWCLSPQYPACAQCASDPDGDSWGWENQRSCIVFASCQ